MAIQLAVNAGSRVIGTASPYSHERLRSLGAEPVAYGNGLLERFRAMAPDGQTRRSTPSARTRPSTPRSSWLPIGPGS